MQLSEIRPLPLGRSSFSALRAKHEIYVDKTDLIFELCRHDSKIFLARPRCFGKTLLVSAFESLFRCGLKDFRGLAIENLWTDKTYKVVRLDFSKIKGCTDKKEFAQALTELLVASFSLIGFSLDGSTIGALRQLDIWLQQQNDSSLVLLIDEYDAPLIEHLDDPVLFKQFESELDKLFSIIKANEGCLRFFFMTGVTKFTSTGIFSAFNNLEDISLTTAYGTLLGFTEREIKSNFSDYLSRAARLLNLDEDVLLDRLRQNYSGFCFDRKASTRVYCPRSLLNFLKSPAEGFLDYWSSPGGEPAVLMKYLAEHCRGNPAAFAQNATVPAAALQAPSGQSAIDITVLLTQAGCLTIQSVGSDGWFTLGFPNKEVAHAMTCLY